MLLATTLLLPLAIAPSEGGDQLAAVQALFDESCTICHDSSAELNLEDAGALVSLKSDATGKPLVVPGDANASYLYLKMIGAEGIEGESMPMGDDILPDDELAKVSGWIMLDVVSLGFELWRQFNGFAPALGAAPKAPEGLKKKGKTK